ncbi:Xpo1-domain-containing protein [Martensiomyces pterosporus]|nr:Xpo1-domain-containing protein [Martensiomyces pterosporus]
MEQIEEAVRCALNPSSDQAVVAQAMQYCEHVKASPDGWQLCLQLFTRIPESTPEARMFALQVIEAMLIGAGVGVDQEDTATAAKLDAVRKSLLQFVSTQYAGPKYQSEVAFIKNKLAHSITLLALATYPAQWPTFVKDMISLSGIPEAGTSVSSINPSLLDFLLKVLSSLDEEMVNPTVPRGKAELARNTEIKDAMRIEDVNRMAHVWYNILVHMSGTHPELARSTLRLMGVYVSWIDINLIVNQPFMAVLFDLLKSPTLHNDACRCLAEIIGKGMRPMEKLYLLQFLSIIDVMGQLETSDVEFAEQVGKLANVTAVELKAIWVDKESATPEARSTAYAMLERLMPLLLRFLSHEYDDVSSTVFAAISDILGMFKRLQREGSALSESQQGFLSQLLPVLVEKLKYDEDYSWPSPGDASSRDNEGSLDEGDEDAMFDELRRNLRVFIDAIGQIAPGLYDSVMLTTAQSIFEQCRQHGGQLGWVRAELGVYLTQAYGDRLSSNKGLRNAATAASIEALSELLTMMIQSGIVSSSHPAIAATYFENFVRFNGYFDVRREAVTPVLTAFLGSTGVRHPYKTVRPRIWYLLHRFIKNLPPAALVVYSSDFIPAVVDLLEIHADPSTISGAGPHTSGYGLFDSQLYLFETCGMMLAPTGLDDGTRMALLQRLFDPLFSGAQNLMNSRSAKQILDDPRSLLQIHHYLTAIGSIIKGFPDVRVDSKSTSPSSPHQLSASTAQVFLKAADMCIAILESLKASEVIREAARFTLSRMLSVLGAEALPYLPRLIDSLVTSCAVEELSDLLGFLGLVVFKFKPHVAPTASELLLPVISKVYGFLDQVAHDGAAGTDESVLLQDLRKAYLTWIAAIFNSDLDSVFLTPQNSQHLITILQPIAAQLAVDCSSPQCQRLAFSVLYKAILAWMEVRVQLQQFVMSTVVPACFEAPTRAEFRISDAQSSLVVSEIASVLQMLLLAGNQFATYLSTALLPGLGCPTAMAAEFVQALASLEPKQFKKYFVGFLSSNSG